MEGCSCERLTQFPIRNFADFEAAGAAPLVGWICLAVITFCGCPWPMQQGNDRY